MPPTTTHKSIAQQRSDPTAVRRKIDSIFEGLSGETKHSYCRFLVASISYLSRHHADRWGVTLREYGVRLNSGMLESLILVQGRPLRILVVRKSAPSGANFDGCRYRFAPGCETVSLPLSGLPRSLAKLTESHHEALRTAAEAMPPSRQRMQNPLTDHLRGNCALWRLPCSELHLRRVRNTRLSQCAIASTNMPSSTSCLISTRHVPRLSIRRSNLIVRYSMLFNGAAGGCFRSCGATGKRTGSRAAEARLRDGRVGPPAPRYHR